MRDQDKGVVRSFFSQPTLEPSITPGNVEAVTAALGRLGVDLASPITSQVIDNYFRTTGRRHKGEFALELVPHSESS